ncbi:MAG TPA: ABC transporter substrate-binding protein [Candidatus Limnocylindrales bacterium]|nr:ABC transporter substrate-binding protein [Candidatus Limnocylindrales bacterium]
MRKPFLGLLASTAIVFGACQGATSPSPSTAPASSAPASAPASESPSASAAESPSGSQDINQILYGANYQPQQGTPGGKVIVGEWQAPNQLNYYFSNAFANTEVLAMTTRSGLLVSADGHYMQDLFAKPLTFQDSVKKDATGNGFTVHAEMKPNEMWSDGQPLTMNDYKFTWQRVNDPDQKGITLGGWDEIDKVDVSSDGLSADFHFKEPFAGWLATIGGNPPLPEHYLKDLPAKNDSKLYPLTADIGKVPVSGPFKYETASADTIELARNDNYKDGTACGGTACLDGITFKSYPDNKDGMIADFKTGAIDLALDLQTADFASIQDVDPSIGKALQAPGWEYEHLDMNQKGAGPGKGNPALQDPVVRKAIAQAIDKKALWSTLFPGTPVPDVTPCQSGVPGQMYFALPQDQATCPGFDVDAANTALDQAGYAKGADGVRTDKSGQPLVLEHCTSNTPVRQTSGDFIAKSLEAIGIKMNTSYVDSTKVFFAGWADTSPDTKCALSRGNYDTGEFAYVLSFDLFGDYYYSYASAQIPTDANKGNGYNWLYLKDPDVDAAIDTLKSALNPADQIQSAYDLQRIIDVEKVYEVALYYRTQVRGLSSRLQNFFQNPGTQSDMWNSQDWFVTQ